MLELLYFACIVYGGLFSDKVSSLLNCIGGGVSCVLVTTSFDVLVSVGGSLDVQ